MGLLRDNQGYAVPREARLKNGKAAKLLAAINDGSLGRGSVAGDEYLHDMSHARTTEEGVAHWVETCFCGTPLEEERPYWEEYFDLVRIQDAHNRKNCRHENGSELWACCNCDCTQKLEERLASKGLPFLETLKEKQ